LFAAVDRLIDRLEWAGRNLAILLAPSLAPRLLWFVPSVFPTGGTMTRLLVLAALFTATTSIAVADDEHRAGRRGTVTAYELDGHTVIESKLCVSRGRYSYDYVRCGNRLRDSVKAELCRKLGGGTHDYLYQIGDARPVRSSVYCGRRD
jgi:hypothetical protein